VGCARCLAADAPLNRALSHAVPPDVVARGLLAVSHVPWLARQRGFRGFVGDAGARFSHLRAAFELVDIAIAPSRFLIEMFGRNGYPADRIRHSPYGMDLSWLPALRPRNLAAPLTFGYLGQIHPLKGVDVLVRAVASLPPRSDVALEIHGDLSKQPAYSDRLRALASGRSDIRFPGPFGRDRIAEVLSGLDVVVVPSRWYENTPLVIYEAFAAGKPVIATNLGGMSEVVAPGVNGMLFERGDASGLAECLRLLVADADLRERLARQVPPVRTIEAETEDLVRIYQDQVESRRTVRERLAQQVTP
jgi:glycosyltransferase involved in cell wall biosynthesis